MIYTLSPDHCLLLGYLFLLSFCLDIFADSLNHISCYTHILLSCPWSKTILVARRLSLSWAGHVIGMVSAASYPAYLYETISWEMKYEPKLCDTQMWPFSQARQIFGHSCISCPNHWFSLVLLARMFSPILYSFPNHCSPQLCSPSSLDHGIDHKDHSDVLLRDHILVCNASPPNSFLRMLCLLDFMHYPQISWTLCTQSKDSEPKRYGIIEGDWAGEPVAYS